MPRVYVSSVINGRSDRVWARVRDFNGLPSWHPGIAESRIENGEPADKVGCVRDFRLRNGDRIREKLLGLSDFDLFCTYAILESPMRVENYVATLRLTPITDGDRTFVEWTAEFECAPEREAELVSTIGGGGSGASGRSATDEVIESVLRYRVQAPMIDEILAEIGIEGGNLSRLPGLIREARDMQAIAKEAKAKKPPEGGGGTSG